MSERTQWILVIGFVAVLALAAVLGAWRAERALPPGAVGSRAPDFAARTLDGSGEIRTLKDYEGSVVLLNVWATWCPPCVEEMPSLQKLHEALGDDGLRIVAVSIDPAGAEQEIRDFARRLGLTFEILHDPGSAITEAYGMYGVPETFLIDARGRIRYKRHATDWFSEENRLIVQSVLDDR